MMICKFTLTEVSESGRKAVQACTWLGEGEGEGDRSYLAFAECLDFLHGAVLSGLHSDACADLFSHSLVLHTHHLVRMKGHVSPGKHCSLGPFLSPEGTGSASPLMCFTAPSPYHPTAFLSWMLESLEQGLGAKVL